AMPKTKFCEGLSDISDSYMAIIFDQWGVLHDGKKAFDGIVDCLKELRSRKKYIILLSNSDLTVKDNKELLKKAGIGPSLYDKIITVGEMIAQGLESQSGKIFGGIGHKCYSFHSGEPHSFMKDLNVEYVDSVQDADFVLMTGWDKLEKPAIELDKELKEIVKRGTKTIFAVPDSRGLLSANYLMGVGLLNRKLRQYGGVIHSIGKPYKPVFHECIETLQEQGIFPGQTVMVGDTMAHDMIGANMAEIDTCLVKKGMHYGAFKKAENPAEVDRALSILINQYNTQPNYLIPSVQWGKALPDRKHRRRLQPGEAPKRRLRKRKL
ncbi:MAG: TIGR01459 family HAD-type hydrolase, partial [Bdellovibrionales bacterium]